jgi:hypothetical protein
MMGGLRERAKEGDKGAESKLHEIEEILKKYPSGGEKAEEEEVPDNESDLSKMMVKSTALQNFGAKPREQAIEVPPTVASRRFNECDVIGNLPRDDKGNVVPEQDKKGKNVDRDGRPTNARGYLIDTKSGDIINDLTGEKMFSAKELDERGELPAPFNVEKHNFNPHAVRGDFNYDRNGKPVVGKDGSGGFKDKRGSAVSSRGYRIDSNGDMLDNHGRKKFDKA